MSEITATKEQQNKYKALKEYLRSLGSVAVAFSSGVDSTFLLKTAHDVLGINVSRLLPCPVLSRRENWKRRRPSVRRKESATLQ